MIRIRSSARFTTKSGRNREVPISSQLKAILEGYADKAKPADYILRPDLPARRGARRWNFVKSFRRVTKAAGIPGLTVHDLRRCFATSAVQRGISVWKVKNWLGHASVRVTEKYTADSSGFDAEINKVG